MTRPPAARCGAPTRTAQPCRSWVDEGERCTEHGGRGRTAAPSPYLPGKPRCAECWLGARILVDSKPMCTRHAAKAARIAAQAAEEAAWWEETFTPRPGQPYRADPEWQAAMRLMIDGADEAVRMCAIFRIHEIETGQPFAAAVLGIIGGTGAPASSTRR